MPSNTPSQTNFDCLDEAAGPRHAGDSRRRNWDIDWDIECDSLWGCLRLDGTAWRIGHADHALPGQRDWGSFVGRDSRFGRDLDPLHFETRGRACADQPPLKRES